MEGPQKHFLTCNTCNERFLVEIPEDPAARQERTAACPRNHEVRYDERTALGPAKPPEKKS
jgi:hypothetical protein